MIKNCNCLSETHNNFWKVGISYSCTTEWISQCFSIQRLHKENFFKNKRCGFSCKGRGGGPNDNVITFNLNRPGLNPKINLKWFFERTSHRMVHTLPSSFLFPMIIYHIIKFISCMLSSSSSRKGKIKSKKRLGKAHFKKGLICRRTLSKINVFNT